MDWKPNSVLHHGELHIYYDLNPYRRIPWCMDFTFYYDTRKVETQLMNDRYDLMREAFCDSLCGYGYALKHILLLPIEKNDLLNVGLTVEQFLHRQQKMLVKLSLISKVDLSPKDPDDGTGNPSLPIDI